MRVATERPVTHVYRVEVSGWDRAKAYFVEKCELEWSEETGKQVTVSSAVADGALLFVRLLQPLSQEQAFPLPYRAEYVRETRAGRQFRLKAVHERARMEH